ncbi:PKD domain-containing protein [Aquimarina algicola]|uniref:DUF11 domain-containing protein n=1 Tax=Aquimarina algicola TaxID=2589995 RepID=A0A504IWD1_9FLAO|nr:gliding motility-associated C-terminal domain-containing protein [Aquimarina algicola]TPN82334.1 DUF11 domain-containing protein [Aquimarina algicola]
MKQFYLTKEENKSYFLSKRSSLSILHFLCFAFFVFLSTLSATAQSCTINAGLDQTICANDVMQLQGNSPDTYASGPTWTQTAGPSVIISDPTIDDPIITGFIPGNTYEFQYAAECFNGDTPSQTVSITVDPITIANAGSDVASCPDSSGSIVITGNAPGSGETGQWTVVGANNAGVNISIPTSASTPITLPETSAGTTTLRWTISSSGASSCSSSDDITVTNYGGELPVSAGPDQTLSNCYTVSQSTNLNGSFGGNNLNGQQGTWTFVSGPTAPTIGNVNNANTGVSGLFEGTYTFRWDVVGPCASGSDTVTITVPAATQDVTNASIQDNNIRLCDASTTQVTLVGSTPDFTNETVLWEQISGPSVTIESPTNSTTQITGLTNPNSYQFRYTITNNVTMCTSVATARVRYNASAISIVVNSGNDITGTCAQTSFDVPFTFTSGNRTDFSIVSGPADSSITFPTPFQNAGNSPTRINVFDVSGTYRVNFRRSRTGDLQGCDEAYDAINITVSLNPSGSNAGSDQFFVCGQINGNLAGSPIQDGELSVWSQVSGPNTATIADIYAQTTPISNMIPGTYVFRYTVSAGPDCVPPATSDTTIEVSPTTNNPVNAGADQTGICVGADVQLAADPGNDAQTGTWSGPPGITFSDINDPNAIASGFNAPSTTYTLTWSLDITDNSGCTLAPATDTVDIVTNADLSPTNAMAGGDQCLASGTTNVPLSGNAPAAGEEGLWSVTPSAGVTFVDATQANTTATVPGDGIYTFTWTIGYSAPPTNSCPSTSDSIEVVISDINAGVSAGTDKSLCLDPVLLSFDMDADPAPVGGEGTWNLVSGGQFTVSDPNDPTATFSNLLDGTYVFEWVIAYGDCPVTTPADQVTVEIGIPPTTANIQGGDQVICAANNTSITADPLTNPTTESGVWSVVSGPNTPNISDPSSNSINVTGLTTGRYIFDWTITSNSPLCPSSSDSIIVDVFAPASAGPDQTLCEVTSILLEATAGTTGTWTQVANGAPASTISQSPSNSNTANATVVPGNTYEFQFATDYTGSGSACNNTDTVTIVVSSGPSTPPTAGPDQILCNGDTTTATMVGNVPPGDPGLTAEWSFVSEPTGSVANITTPAANNTTITGLSVPGLYILQWNFSVANCTDEADIMRIEVFDAPTPIEAGPDQTNACQQDAQLNATTPTVGIGTWSFANPGDDPSGGAVVIDSPNNPQTTLSNIPDDVGNDGIDDVYVLTWTVSNGGPFPSPTSACNPQSDTVTLTFTGAPPTPADAGPDQNLCDDTQTFLDAVPVTSGTGTWTQTSGPPGATIAAPNNPNSLVIDLSPGTFEFTWTTTGGGCTSTDVMEVTIVSDPIVAEAGPDQSLPELSVVTLDATPATAPAVGQWTQVSGPTTANFVDDANPTTDVTGTTVGTYIFEWTVTNGSCDPRRDRVTIQITPIIDLELIKSVLPSAAKVGETVTFTVAIENTSGTSNATGVEVVDIIPNGYTLVPGTVSNSGLYNAGNLSITWSGLNITSASTLNLTFDAVVNATGPYNNSAQITASNEFDPDSTPNNNDPLEDDQDEATVTITPNDPPVAVDDQRLNNTLGDPVAVLILNNDSDSDGTLDTESVDLDTPVGATGIVTDLDGDVIGFTVPGEGTWAYDDDTGELTFSPEPGFTGNPTDITYTVRDDSGNTSNVANVNIEYTFTPPVANDDTNLTPTPINDPTALNIINNDLLAEGSTPNPSDVDVDLDLTTPGIQNSLNVPGEGNWVYDPASGIVTFTPQGGFTTNPTPITYELTDLDNGQTDTALITVTYQQPPVAVDDSNTGNTPGTTVNQSITANDNDPDGLIDPDTVNLTVPVGALNTVTDINGNIIGFDVPGEGTWSYNRITGLLSFTPEDGFTGNPTDITYTVRDDDGNVSNLATVTVGYTPTPPVANDDTNATPTPIGDNTDLAILTNDELADGTTPDVSDVSIDLDPGTPGIQTTVNVPGEGDWTYNPTTGIVTFDPEPAFTGNPTPITYEMTDLDNGQTDTALITVTYQQPPVAVDDSNTGNTPGTTVSIAITGNDNDPDGTIDPTSVNLTTPVGATGVITDLDGNTIGFTVPGEGTWSYDETTGQLSFDPQDGFTGDPTPVTYTVDDNDGNTSNLATVTVGYTPTPPVANDDTNATPTPIGDNTDLAILTNDELADGTTPDVSDVTIDLDPGTPGIQTTVNVPGEGDWTYNPTTGIVTFDPEPAFTGNPTPITYEMTDLDNGQTDTALITVTYQQPPVAVDDSNTGNTPGTTVSIAITGNDNDPDGTIDPTSVNLTTPGGATGIVTDLDGNTIGFTVPGEGTWSYDETTGQLSFDPQDGFTGDPTPVTYTVDDNDGNTSNLATVTVGYTPTPPVANDDTNATPTPIGDNTDLAILTNDELADGTTPDVSDVTIDLDPGTPGIQTTVNVPGEGDWTYNPTTGIVTFDPEPAFTGNPTPITYEMTDLDNGQTDTALITVTYQQPPVAVDDSNTGNTPGTTVSIAITGNDNDPDGTIDPTSVNLTTPGGATGIVTDLDGNVIGFTVPGEGTWSYDETTGQLSFDPQDGFTGDPTPVTYTVDDNDGNTSNLATVTVGYTPTPPVANDDTNATPTPIGNNTDLAILTNDELADGTTPDVSDVSIDLDPGTPGIQTTINVIGEGEWTYNPTTGIVTFDPEPAFTGNPTPITYEMTDLDNGQTDTALITVTYQQPPVAVDDSNTGNTPGTIVSIAITGNDNDPDGTIDPTSVNLTTPVGATGIVTDLDGNVIGFTVPGQGTWSYNETTGQLSFDPQDGFTSDPTPVTYTVDDNDGNTSNLATVTVGYTPIPPVPNDDNSSNNVTNNSVTLNIINNDVLADGSTPLPSDVFVDLVIPVSATSIVIGANFSTIGFTVPGEGDWLYNETTGQITFTPEAGFTGDPTPIDYNIIDADNLEISVAPATITIDYAIQPPVAVDNEDLNNNPGDTVDITILTNDSDPDGTLDPNGVNLIPPTGATGIITDGDGDVTEFTVTGEGTWTYNPATQTLSFDPDPGFITDPTPIFYTVDDNDGNPSNQAEVRIDYLDVADLSLIKRVVDNDITPFTGTEITFEVRVTNDGPALATGVSVTDLLPNGYDFVLYSSTAGVYDETTGIWNIGTIPSGDTETLLIDVLVNETGNYTNVAQVTASGVLDLDSTPNNNILAEDDQDEVVVTPVLTPRIDLSVTKIADDLTPDVGGTITFTMTVTNDGPSNATNVVVTDLLASGYQYVSSTVTTGTYEPLNGSWTIGNLSNGVTQTLTITANVLATGDYTNVVEVTDATENDIDSTPANNDDTEDDQVTIRPVPVSVSDLAVTKTVDNATPRVGDNVDFTILLENLGLSNASGIEVTDVLPTGYTFVSYEATAGIYDDVTGVWAVNRTLVDGDIERLTITATVNPTGPYSNTAEITASDNLDSDTANNISTIGTTPVAIADLSLVKTVSNTNPDVTDNITFTLTVTNDGPSVATGIIVTDPIPSGFNHISNTSGGAYNPASGLWNIPTLGIGATTTIDITVSINTLGSYINVAEITAVNEIDPDSTPGNGDINEDDQDEVQVFPRVITDIEVTKTVDSFNPEVGDQITFTVTIINNGPSNATGIVVEDVIASGYSFDSASPSIGTYDETIGSWDIGNMANGTTETLDITVTVLPSGIYSNTAELIALDTFDPDSNPDNNVDSEDDQDTVNPRPSGLADLSIEKVVSNTAPLVGDSVEFTINVTNSGDSDATGVEVTDRLPAGYTFESFVSTAGLYDSSTGIWSLNGTILNGTTESLIILATVNEPSNTTDEYINIAEITRSDQADPDSDTRTGIDVDDLGDGLPDDDESRVVVTPQFVDIAIGKSVAPTRVTIGDEVVFTITATNDNASVNATNVVIEDLLPQGYQYISSDASSGDYDPVRGLWTLSGINTSETETLNITVRVLDVDDYINVAGLLDVDQFDINTANNRDDAFVETQCLTIFNEFSPNNDGVNDTFNIDCISRFPDNRLEIYNRWGNIVYEKDNYDNSWDGTSNGRAVIYTEDKLPVGTYYYILNLGDGSEPKAGWIYLNR